MMLPTQCDVLRAHRLANIKAGRVKPRWHKPEEANAYHDGQDMRRTLTALFLVAFVVWGAVGVAVNRLLPPVVVYGALDSKAENGGAP